MSAFALGATVDIAGRLRTMPQQAIARAAINKTAESGCVANTVQSP